MMSTQYVLGQLPAGTTMTMGGLLEMWKDNWNLGRPNAFGYVA